MTKIYVISGAGGMTGIELVKQIAKTDKTAHLILFDNGFNCDLLKLSNLCKLTQNKKDVFLGKPYSINSKEFLKKLKSVIGMHIYDLCSINHEKIELIFVNCAAVVHTKWFYQPQSTFKTNVEGMLNFLNIANEYWKEMKDTGDVVKFINCSTSEVYSMQSYKRGGVCEDDFVQLATSEHSLRTSYAMGKLLTEMFAKESFKNTGLKTCSIRFANVYTEDELLPEHIIPYIIYSIKHPKSKSSAEKIEIHLLENAVNTFRTFLHNHDSASAVLALAISNDENVLNGACYNVGTEEEFQIKEVVDIIANEFGLSKDQYEILYDIPARKADPQRRLLNCSRIMTRTGWKPIVNLYEGIKRCVEVAKNQ